MNDWPKNSTLFVCSYVIAVLGLLGALMLLFTGNAGAIQVLLISLIMQLVLYVCDPKEG